QLPTSCLFAIFAFGAPMAAFPRKTNPNAVIVQIPRILRRFIYSSMKQRCLKPRTLAARCGRNFRTWMAACVSCYRSIMGSERDKSITRLESQQGRAVDPVRSLRLDVGRADHLGPLLGFAHDMSAEFRRRARRQVDAEARKPRLHGWIGRHGV